jgi:DNA-binding transcriptional LysR family regulator
MMDLNQLAVFVRVVDAGSFTKASRSLKQPKSRVSRRIAALERDLGVVLLYRTTRQFHPTEAGRALYAQTRDHVYALDAAASSLRENAAEVSGVLRVTATTDVGSALLGAVIGELATLHPKMTVDLHLSEDVVDLVRDGMDLAVRIGALKDTSLKSRALGRIIFIVVASPDYLARAPRLEAVADLSAHQVLAFSSAGVDSVWTLRAPGKREEAVKIRAQFRANNPRILLDLALAGKGVALLPEFLCVDALKDGTLQRPLKHATKPWPVHFVWPGQRETPPKVRAFVDLVVEHLKPYFS